ncbi:MAG: DUF4440 domain-containing protein [Caulobacteraceae bacterium]
MDAEADAVVETMREMFAAAAVDDFARLGAILDEDFYAFDMETRFDGTALSRFIRDAHAQGAMTAWEITEPDVRVEGDLAWISYVNRGAIEDADGAAPAIWLESAILQRRDGHWRIRFISQPALREEPEADAEVEAVVETVRGMFAAAAAEDFTRLKAILDEDFYGFDMERPFDGEALVELVRDTHAQGTAIVWEVAEPDVHIEGDLAWVAYANRGAIRDAEGVERATWLESAVLRRRDGRWRIRFFHSTRVVAPSPAHAAGKEIHR